MNDEKEIEYIIHHEGSEIEEFLIDGYNFRKLLLQLQTYKDKEDKLREYILNNSFKSSNNNNDIFTTPSFRIEELLKIINEGSDK